MIQRTNSPVRDSNDEMTFRSVSPDRSLGSRSSSSYAAKAKQPKALLQVHLMYIGLFAVYAFFINTVHLNDVTLSSIDDTRGVRGLQASDNVQILPHIKPRERTFVVPDCAKTIVVDLFDEEDSLLCYGFLLRDDLVLAKRSCVDQAHTVEVWQPNEPLLMRHREAEAQLVLQRRLLGTKTIVNHQTALVSVEMPEVHFQSDWPRQRSFVKMMESTEDEANHEDRLLDDDAHALSLSDGSGLHLQCLWDNLPVVDSKSHEFGLPADFSSILQFPRDQDAAVFSNKLGEHWWIPKQSKEVLTKSLFSRWSRYSSADRANTTLDILRGPKEKELVTGYYLEAEDPKFRLGKNLFRLFEIWSSQEPFRESHSFLGSTLGLDDSLESVVIAARTWKKTFVNRWTRKD